MFIISLNSFFSECAYSTKTKIAASFALGLVTGPTAFVGYHEFQWRAMYAHARTYRAQVVQGPICAQTASEEKDQLLSHAIDFSFEAQHYYAWALVSQRLYGNFTHATTQVFPSNR